MKDGATISKTALIRERLAGGGVQILSDLAREMGVSRQLVAMIKRDLDNNAGPPRKRGRPRLEEQRAVSLTKEQADSFEKKLRQGVGGGPMTPASAKTWLRYHFGKKASRRFIREFAKQRGIALAPDKPNPNAGWTQWSYISTPPTRPAAVKKAPPAAAAADNEVLLPSDKAELKRFNEEKNRLLSAMREAPLKMAGHKFGRNEPCPFDAKLKFKRCCGADGAKTCRKLAASAAAPSEK